MGAAGRNSGPPWPAGSDPRGGRPKPSLAPARPLSSHLTGGQDRTGQVVRRGRRDRRGAQETGLWKRVARFCRGESVRGQRPVGSSSRTEASTAGLGGSDPASLARGLRLWTEAIPAQSCGRDTDSGHWPACPEETVAQGTNMRKEEAVAQWPRYRASWPPPGLSKGRACPHCAARPTRSLALPEGDWWLNL